MSRMCSVCASGIVTRSNNSVAKCNSCGERYFSMADIKKIQKAQWVQQIDELKDGLSELDRQELEELTMVLFTEKLLVREMLHEVLDREEKRVALIKNTVADTNAILDEVIEGHI